MDLHTKIAHFVSQYNLLYAGQKIVVGFSGGPDSVFLVYVLLELQKSISISLHLAHLDHHWRETSFKDVQFCTEFAAKHKLFLTVGSAHDFSSLVKCNGSKEEFARNMRKAFFNDVIAKTKSTTLALAHHADDQLETFFIRLTRGATISGIKGMLPYENNIIRPLLSTSKKDIVHFLDEQAISYCIDETNSSNLFLRNRIRNSVVPAAHLADPRFITNSLRTITHLAEAEKYLAAHTQDLFTDVSCILNGIKWINTKTLSTFAPFMQKRIIMHWLCTEKIPFQPSEKLIHEIIRFLYNTKSSTHIMYNWRIQKKHNLASLSIQPQNKQNNL